MTDQHDATTTGERMTTQIVEYSKTEAALADLSGRYKNVVFDVATREGMVSAIKARAELRGYRVALEKTRVELKAPALERTRLIDAEAKRISAELVALEDPIDETIKSEESRKERERAERERAERDRIAAIQATIAEIGATPGRHVSLPSQEIADGLAAMRERVIDASFGEFQVQAAEAKGKAVAALEQLHAGALAQEHERRESQERAEAERQELARLRREQEERQRQEATARAEREAADRKAREALEAEQRAAREKIEQEDREAKAKRAVDDAAAADARKAEQERVDVEQRAARAERERAESARREAERLHNELIDGEEMLRKFVERFGRRREFAGVVKAINAHLKPTETQVTALRA